jgi:Uma2 family endonuclease
MTPSSANGGTLRHADRSDFAEETYPMHMAQTTHGWTLEELHRLPDDGNKYELVRGELFVTPPPSVAHEEVASLLGRILEHHVARVGLGRVYHPRAVLRVLESEVEPDLMVRAPTRPNADWADAPLPILVVEILSDSTRRRDHVQKREFYLDAGVPEYWIVDGQQRTIRVAGLGRDDVVATESLAWHPAGSSEPLVIDVRTFFREALG